MSAYLALAVSVGLLAVLDTWLYVGPLAATLPGLVWISFIAWGCHYHSGGGTKGSLTTVICMTFGALVGMVAVMLASGPLAGTGQLAAPIAVGLGATVICLASKVPYLATIPASVYGFASIAGPILLANLAPEKAIVPTVISVIIGAAFGWVSEMLANAMTSKKGPSAETASGG
jgi:hypothetical protein